MISKSDISERIKQLPVEIKKLVEKRIELFALDFGNQVSKIFAELLYRLTGVIVLALGLIFLIQALAIFVGDLVGDQSLGYLIVASPIVLLGILFISLRPKFMVRKTRNRMTEQILSSIKKDDQGKNNG